MRSIRFQFIAFISALLIVLLVLLNTYPLISSRDAVFEEKRSSMGSQASLLASSLASLERLSREGVSEVLRFLDVSGMTRIVVADSQGLVVYDSGGSVGLQTDLEDIRAALTGKTVFRSAFRDEAFSSSMVMPMSSQGAITGAVYLYEHDAQRAGIILNIQHRIRAASLSIGAIALLLAGLYVWALTRRLAALARSMHVVAGGDYAYRHQVRGRDEISELGREFNLLTERLQSTEEQRRRFISDASHELKTPLASIRLLADSITQSQDMGPAMVREFVGDIGTEVRRLQRTTEKMLDLSRLDDRGSEASRLLDLGKAVRDALPPLRHLAQEKQVELKSQLPQGCLVLSNPEDLDHIIFNLTENAIKYNVPGGSVELRLEQDEETVRLIVSDTGIGIPEEDRPHIFSRFYRVDKARSREAGGSGLGLSIVHDAVKAQGGSISVSQNSPQGSVFTVSFPRPTKSTGG